jgi:hypothetical protein
VFFRKISRGSQGRKEGEDDYDDRRLDVTIELDTQLTHTQYDDYENDDE